MAEFIAYAGPGSGDYVTLQQWITALNGVDFTAADTGVFPVSSYGGALGAGASVQGQNSGATGTCKSYANTGYQNILISGISGTFQAGEKVYQVGTPTNYVNISTAGTLGTAGITPVAECSTSGTVDSIAATLTGFTCDNWIIRAKSGYEQTSPLSSANYVRNLNSGINLRIQIPNGLIQHIGFYGGSFGGPTHLQIEAASVVVDSCYFSGFNQYGGKGIYINDSDGSGFVIRNCGFSWLRDATVIDVNCATDGCLVATCTINKGDRGIQQAGNSMVKVVDTIVWDTDLEDFDTTYTWGSGTDYNFSKDDSAPGAHSIHGDTDGKDPDFVTETESATNIHLDVSSDAFDPAGIGPGADSDVPTDDFDVPPDTRGGSTADIGFDQVSAAGTTTTTTTTTSSTTSSSTSTSSTTTAPSSGGAATNRIGETAGKRDRRRAVYRWRYEHHWKRIR